MSQQTLASSQNEPAPSPKNSCSALHPDLANKQTHLLPSALPYSPPRKNLYSPDAESTGFYPPTPSSNISPNHHLIHHPPLQLPEFGFWDFQPQPLKSAYSPPTISSRSRPSRKSRKAALSSRERCSILFPSRPKLSPRSMR